MDKFDWFGVGMLLGTIISIIVLMLLIGDPTKTATTNGYLTHNNKTYTVTLYDELEIPENKDAKNTQ